MGAACSDPAPPEPAVASITFSIPDTGTSIRFRDPLVVKATPQGALGVPLTRAVAWSSVTPSLLTVLPLNANGDSARIQASGVGRGEIRVSAGGQNRSFQVTVQDTVFSVTLTPGSLSLIAGDTVSFTATVAGPPNASRAIQWDVSNATVAQTLPTLDSLVFRLQVRAAGVTSVRATALADATKGASATVTAQMGLLAFLSQPATTAREVPFNPGPVIVVRDPLGTVSARATNAITLSVAPGACAAALTGTVTVSAANGVAQFPDVASTARCAALALSATSSPPAAPATSQNVSVTARGCEAVVPMSASDTVHAQVEGADCVRLFGGRPFYSHTYVFTVPVTTPIQQLVLDLTTSAFVPRIEANLWPEDPLVTWTDSLSATGTLSTRYVLGPGTYRFNITSTAPQGTGVYSAITSGGTLLTVGRQGACRVATARGVSFLVLTPCSFAFASRPGGGDGRAFLIYVPPNKAVTLTNRIAEGPSDPYLELFDVTDASSPASLIAFDDNGGGGTAAQLIVSPAPSGRFLEVRALLFGQGAAFSVMNLTISP